MKNPPQPAIEPYFLNKAFKDCLATVKGAWRLNLESIQQNIDHALYFLHAFRLFAFLFFVIWNSVAIIVIFLFGTLITTILSLLLLFVISIFTLSIYIFLFIIWLIDFIYLTRHKIFTSCEICKEKSLIPAYLCPKCGVSHTNLVPGKYGILKRVCAGTGKKKCGQLIPTVFFNGRAQLTAQCAQCHSPLFNRESIPLCIPIVGGRSVGKTAFINAFAKAFIDKKAEELGWTTSFYNKEKASIFAEINRDFRFGTTRMTARTEDVTRPSATAFSFFLQGPMFRPERLLHIYDISGEVFTNQSENEIQKQYEYCHGIIFMLDPLSLDEIKLHHQAAMTPEDLAGIGQANLNLIINAFLNKLQQVTGLSEQKMSQTPLAVVIGKIDSANLDKQLGPAAIKEAMEKLPSTHQNKANVQDYLCRQFLKDNGMGNFVQIIEMKFSHHRFFACSAIGHAREKGPYKPYGVLKPMEWLLRQADSTIDKYWQQTDFSEKPFAAKSKLI